MSTLLIDPDATPRVVYAGTDFGVFRATDDGSGRWEGFNNGLPPVVVTRFAYNAVTRTFLAATYGPACGQSQPDGRAVSLECRLGALSARRLRP